MSKTPEPPYLDEEERELLSEVEKALEAGKIVPKTEAEMEALRTHWKSIAHNTAKHKAITLRLQERDIRRLKSQAKEKGLPYQTYLTSVLHQLASGKIITR
jgi:predicted DNA binding CopG/RHH family protein